jgi:Na+-transporting methylmalonyl-CoA/oxaloacetate decarboxylase gamma subunit
MTETLNQSLILTGAGMAIVFVFMGALIALVYAFLAVARKVFPDREGDDEASGAPSRGSSGAGNDASGKPDDGVVAAIAGAMRTKE